MSTPITITVHDLLFTLFGSHESRSAHIDEANYHWNRRAGIPIHDLPSKIILPHIASAIQAADPNEVYAHIQTVVASPELTYHVLWLRSDWLNSVEKQRVSFHASHARVATFTAVALKRDRLGLIAHRLHTTTTFKLRECESIIYNEWYKAQNEQAFQSAINRIETLLSQKLNSIYEPTNEDGEEKSQDDREDDQEKQGQQRSAGDEKVESA